MDIPTEKSVSGQYKGCLEITGKELLGTLATRERVQAETPHEEIEQREGYFATEGCGSGEPENARALGWVTEDQRYVPYGPGEAL